MSKYLKKKKENYMMMNSPDWLVWPPRWFGFQGLHHIFLGFTDKNVLVFCLYPSSLPVALCYCCSNSSVLLHLWMLNRATEFWLFPLDLPLFPHGCCSHFCLKCSEAWRISLMSQNVLGSRCCSRPAKILPVGMRDPYLHDFCFTALPIGCGEEVGQNGQPSLH